MRRIQALWLAQHPPVRLGLVINIQIFAVQAERGSGEAVPVVCDCENRSEPHVRTWKYVRTTLLYCCHWDYHVSRVHHDNTCNGAVLLSPSYFADRPCLWHPIQPLSLARTPTLQHPSSRTLEISGFPKSRHNAIASFLVLNQPYATLLPYLAGIGLVAAEDPGPAPSAGLILYYCSVMITPALVLLTGRVLAGPLLQGPLQKLEQFLSRHAGGTVALILFLVGLFLGLNALEGLS